MSSLLCLKNTHICSICICVYIYVHMCIHVYVCIYTSIYLHVYSVIILKGTNIGGENESET